MYPRAAIYEGNMRRKARTGDGMLSAPLLATIATDAAISLTVDQIIGGIVQFTGFTAGRNITVPTAASILAALPEMDIGDTLLLHFSVTTAFAGTWVTNTGVTLAGRATIPASGNQFVLIEKLSATTIRWTAV
jgi:hypothetical protein